MRENVVDQHPSVQQINPATSRFQILAVELEIAWIAHDRGHALTFEARLQDFELAPSRDFAPIHNPDDWWRRVAAPLSITREQRFEQHLHRFVFSYAIAFPESLHYGQGKKHFGERLRVAGPGGGFSVVFRKLQGIGQEKCMEPRSGARSAVAGRNSREPLLV